MSDRCQAHRKAAQSLWSQQKVLGAKATVEQGKEGVVLHESDQMVVP